MCGWRGLARATVSTYGSALAIYTATHRRTIATCYFFYVELYFPARPRNIIGTLYLTPTLLL